MQLSIIERGSTDRGACQTVRIRDSGKVRYGRRRTFNVCNYGTLPRHFHGTCSGKIKAWELGEAGRAGGAHSWRPRAEPTVSFVINSITVDGPCTNPYAISPENGHFVILDVSVQTEPALADTEDPHFYIGASDWKAIAPNGTTCNANAGTAASFGCLTDPETLPQMLGPAEQTTGKVVLDVENSEGTLIPKAPATMAGWEWTYPTL